MAKTDTLLDEIFQEHFYPKVLWGAIRDIHDSIPEQIRDQIWELPSEDVLQVMNEVLEEDDPWFTFAKATSSK